MGQRAVSIFSFFAGAGFLDLGFEKSGFETVYVNEYWQPFLEAYKYAREKLGILPPRHGYSTDDIKLLLSGDEAKTLGGAVRAEKSRGRLVGFIGGPPCPDFSVAGKNRGRHGDNGVLSAVYTDIIVQQKPDFFLFENVRGLWKTKRHREFYEELKVKLQDAGYLTTERLINAIEYGAPQDRERIILIGFRAEAIGRRVDGGELAKDAFPWLAHAPHRKELVFAQKWPGVQPFKDGSKRKGRENLSELTAEHWFGKNQVDRHPNSEHYFKPRAGLARFKSVSEGDVSRKSYKRLHRWRYSPTVAYGNNEVHLHPYRARRLTVAEAMSLQSLPKEFELPADMTLSNMFKTIGNGVPFLAAKGVALAIRDFLKANA